MFQIGVWNLFAKAGVAVLQVMVMVMWPSRQCCAVPFCRADGEEGGGGGASSCESNFCKQCLLLLVRMGVSDQCKKAEGRGSRCRVLQGLRQGCYA